MPVVSVNSRAADGTPELKEGEQVLATQPNVSLYFLPQTSEGSGVVYVTTMYAPSPSSYRTFSLSRPPSLSLPRAPQHLLDYNPHYLHIYHIILLCAQKFHYFSAFSP